MSAKIKRTNDELKASRPTEEEVTKIPRLPISILVENVRSVHNVGSIFRSADGFGASKIYLTGYTACPPREDISKTALGAERLRTGRLRPPNPPKQVLAYIDLL